MAPQLVTLRLDNDTVGIPISLIRQLLTVSIRLERLDTTVLVDTGASTPFEPSPSPLDLVDLPPLHLGCMFDSWFSERRSVTEPKPVHERLWAFFEHWDDGAVEIISTLRRVERVVLERWVAERYPGGEEYAIEKMKEKGLRLEFASADSFYAQ